MVDGTINGVKVGVMLDTGAERTMIMRSAAKRLNLPREQIPGIKMEGIGGVSNAESARIASFGVGESVRSNWSMIVAGDHDAGQVAVLLGDDFLQGADIEFDLAHDTVRLFQPKDCKGPREPARSRSTRGSEQGRRSRSTSKSMAAGRTPSSTPALQDPR